MPTTRSRAKKQEPTPVVETPPIEPKTSTKNKVIDTYYNQKTGFNTAEAIAKYLKMKRETVKETLEKNSEIYQRTAKVTHPTRIKWIAQEPGEILHADIFFLRHRLTKKEQKNDPGENWAPPKTRDAIDHPFSIAVDVYSRYLWLKKLPGGKGDNIEAFEEIIDEIKTVNPEIETVKIVTDDGREFNRLAEIDGVQRIISKSEFGASIAEAHIARVRKLVRKIEGDRRNLIWTDLATNLNNRLIMSHSKTATPFELFNKTKTVTQEQPEVKEDKHLIGAIVRKLETVGKLFDKKSEHIPFSKELYKIIDIQEYNGRIRYKIQEIVTDVVDENRWYYYQQLKAVDIDFLKKYR